MNLKICKYILLSVISGGFYSCATMSGNVDGVTGDQFRKAYIPQYSNNGRGEKMPALLEGKTMEGAKEILGKNPVFQGIKKTPKGSIGILVYSTKGDLRMNYNLSKAKTCHYLYFYEQDGMRYRYGTNAGRNTYHSAGNGCTLGAFNDYQTIFPK